MTPDAQTTLRFSHPHLNQSLAQLGLRLGACPDSCCHHCEFMCPGQHPTECRWCRDLPR